MGWVKYKVIQSEESGICDRIIVGSVIMCLVGKNFVVKSGIIDGFLN